MIEISCQDNLYGKNKIAVQHEEDTLTQKSRIRRLYTHVLPKYEFKKKVKMAQVLDSAVKWTSLVTAALYHTDPSQHDPLLMHRQFLFSH